MKPGLIICFLLSVVTPARADGGRMLIGAGGNVIFFRPPDRVSANGLKIGIPGMYFKAGGESFTGTNKFIHSELCLSLNRGNFDRGRAKTSLLHFNYGFGIDLGMIKCSVSPGFSFFSSTYTDTSDNTTMRDSRFAPSVGVQLDFALINTADRYLSLFTEFNFMLHNINRQVHQLSAGICWRPAFGRPEPAAVSPL